MIHFPREETYGDKINKLYAFEKEDRYKYKDSTARTITFQLTEDCNLCCSYCYQINKAKHKMDFETAKKAVDVILNVDKNVDINNYIDSKNTLGCILEFIGGEPFLEVDLMDQITDYFIETLIKKGVA